jgi:hypothetical protein
MTARAHVVQRLNGLVEFVGVVHVPARRDAVDIGPVMAVGDPRRPPGPVRRIFVLAGEEMRQRPVCVEGPPLGIVRAQVYGALEVGKASA